MSVRLIIIGLLASLVSLQLYANKISSDQQLSKFKQQEMLHQRNKKLVQRFLTTLNTRFDLSSVQHFFTKISPYPKFLLNGIIMKIGRKSAVRSKGVKADDLQ